MLESNAYALAGPTPHPCDGTGQKICEGKACDGVCDKSGCGFAPYRLGNPDFYGPGSGKQIDSTKKFTVVTQFLTHDGTPTGELVEIRRLYVQGGRVIKNSKVAIPPLKPFDSVNEEFCRDVTALFEEKNEFQEKGGLGAIGGALDRGLSMVISLWADQGESNMRWLDGTFPIDAPANKPGVLRGPCPARPANGTSLEAAQVPADAMAEFSLFRFGELDSTYVGSSPGKSEEAAASQAPGQQVQV